MATFRIIPILKNENQQGFIPIAIRITHKRTHRYVQSPYTATKKQLDKSGEVKDISLKPKLNLLWNEVKEILDELGFRVNAYSPDDLREYVKRKLAKATEAIDFFTFSTEYIESIKANQPATATNHNIALNNLRRFLGEDRLNIRDITEKFLHSYVGWMRKEGGIVPTKKEQKPKYKPLGERGQSLHLGSIRKLFNEAVRQHNDYDKGDIPIPNRPFDRFKIQKAKAQKTSESKALTVKQLQAIRDYEPKAKRDELARDCFMLSFYLCGMNSVDLYSCANVSRGIITYNRAKTVDRRMDNAEVRVSIEPEAEVLYQKYKGKKAAFMFNELYANRSNFNMALNKGLKKMGRELAIPDLTFYYARHSWATIASNECDVPIEIVGMALGHADSKTITNIYIKKDWGKVYRANRMVLDLLKEKDNLKH